MPSVPVAVRRERASRLREAGRAAMHQFMAAQVGHTVSLLTETADTGHTEHFAAVRLAQAASPAKLLDARVVGVADDALLAEAA